MGGFKTLDGRYNIKDTEHDILSHSKRADWIHILSLDPILANDVYERIHNDPRMKNYRLHRPRKAEIRGTAEEIEAMALDTVRSRLLIIDVRKEALPKLRTAYNKIVGYNRRDLNNFCFIILIGIRLASEKMHLYPLFFEDWVYELTQRTKQR